MDNIIELFKSVFKVITFKIQITDNLTITVVQ